MRQKRVSLRKCTGCGEMKAKKDLIRVVKRLAERNPNREDITCFNHISLDLTEKKIGRGAYVCKNLTCLKAARKSRAFEKAFSCRIEEGVYHQIEEKFQIMNEALLSLLGIAKKSGRLSLGYNTTCDSLQKSQAQLVLFSSDISERTMQKVVLVAEDVKIEHKIIQANMNQIAKAIGKRVVVIAVNDKGFAQKIKELCKKPVVRLKGNANYDD